MEFADIHAWISDTSIPPADSRKRRASYALQQSSGKHRTALAPRDPNMMPHRDRITTRSRSKSPSKTDRLMRSAGTGEDAGTATPRVRQPWPLVAMPLASSEVQDVFSTAPSLTRMDNVSVVSGSSTSRTRKSTSPVKNPSDLLLAARTVDFVPVHGANIPRDVDDLYKGLCRVKKGVNIIPASMEGRVRAQVQEYEVDDRWFDKNSSFDVAETDSDWKKVQKLVKTTAQHERFSAAEVAWNEDVHRPLLRRALKQIPMVESHNVTSARPCSALVSHDIAGFQQGSKIVDYTINLECSSEVDSRIRSLISFQPNDLKTINQTNYSYVRFKPAAVSIETKTEAGDNTTARTQLAAWAIAHFARLRILARTPLPTHPLVLMTPDTLSIFFAIDHAEENCIRIIRAIDMGSIRSVVEFYKALETLRLLGRWADSEYRKWVEEVLLS